MFHTFTDYTWFCLKILLTDVTSSRVPICIRLVLSGKEAEGAENGVFFQIKENKFFSYGEESLFWSKTDSLLSCSFLCVREASCRSANFLEKAGLCYLLRDEILSSAAGRLLEQAGSFYLKKVFYIILHVFCFTCYSFRMATCDHFSIITTRQTVARSFPSEGRVCTAKLITVTIISKKKP